MNCKSIQSRISGYIDRELGTDEAMEVRNHLRDCEACRVEEVSLRKVKSLMQSFTSEEPSDDLADRILANVFVKPKSEHADMKLARRRVTLAALAAGSLILFGGVYSYRSSQMREARMAKASGIELDIARDRMMLRDGDLTSGAPIVSASYVGR